MGLSRPPARNRTPPPLTMPVVSPRPSRSLERKPDIITEETISYPIIKTQRQPPPKGIVTFKPPRIRLTSSIPRTCDCQTRTLRHSDVRRGPTCPSCTCSPATSRAHLRRAHRSKNARRCAVSLGSVHGELSGEHRSHTQALPRAAIHERPTGHHQLAARTKGTTAAVRASLSRRTTPPDLCRRSFHVPHV